MENEEKSEFEELSAWIDNEDNYLSEDQKNSEESLQIAEDFKNIDLAISKVSTVSEEVRIAISKSATSAYPVTTVKSTSARVNSGSRTSSQSLVPSYSTKAQQRWLPVPPLACKLGAPWWSSRPNQSKKRSTKLDSFSTNKSKRTRNGKRTL